MKRSYQISGILLIAALCLSACGGGSSSGGTSGTAGGGVSPSTASNIVHVPKEAQIRTPSSAYVSFDAQDTSAVQSAKSFAAAAASGNTCYTVVAQPNGSSYATTQSSSQYYSTATVSFNIKNTCSTAQPMSGLQVTVSNFVINGQAGLVNWIEQGSGNPYLSLTSKTTGNDLGITLSTPACTGDYCDWALMPAGSTRAFTVNAYANAAISSLSVGGVSVNGGGSTPPVEPTKPGSLAISVNSAALAPLCVSSTTCKIGVNVLAPSGSPVGEIWVNPYESPSYTVTYTNLLVGTYSLSVDPSTYPSGSNGSISVSYVPATGIIQVNSDQTSNASVTFGYTAPKPIGNLTVKAGTVAEASTTFANIGNLSGSAVNTSTKVVTTFTVALNGSVALNNLPSGSYAVSVQGLADPASGVYYSGYSGLATVTTGSTTNVSASFTKVAGGTHNVSFVVSNAPNAQSVSYGGTSPSYKYNVNTLVNGTAAYKFLTSESAVALTLSTPPTGYTVDLNPKVIAPATSTVMITYTAPVVPPVTPVTDGNLTTFNDQIVDSSGNAVKLKGINWFGFNNGDMLNGMWNYDSLSGDFAVTVQRLKGLGFNSVRLPFSFVNLNGAIQSNYTHNITPATIVAIQANLTNPSYSTGGKVFPVLSYNPVQTSSNILIPNDTVLHRFTWVIDFFARNGFYVLIDDHTEDPTIGSSGVTAWANNWKSLATTITSNMQASSSGRVMYDLLNEPDARGYNWTQMGPAYLAAMDAINSVTQGQNLFFIEGSGQSGINANWGDGFATNKTVISQSGLSDPNPFFTQLATKPYINQVVLSPHIYPPSVTNAGTDYIGAGLYNRLSTSFGTLAKTGYCVSVVCHRFPIAVGEFGSFFIDARDLQFFPSFANYLNYTNDAQDGLHNAIDSWFYWSYNPNSGDTGGIVDTSWTNVEWAKINYLSNGTISGVSNNPNGLGLNPWYK